MHGVDAFDIVVKNIKDFYEYRKKNNIKSIRVGVSSIYDERYKEELKNFEKYIEPY